MMKSMSKINITNLVRPELRTGSAMVSKPPSPEGTMGNTFGAVVLSLPNDDWMLLEEEEWNEGFQVTSQSWDSLDHQKGLGYDTWGCVLQLAIEDIPTIWIRS